MTELLSSHARRVAEQVLDEEGGFPAAVDLIAAKRAGERVALAPDARVHWMVEIDRSFGLLDEARDRSPLPDEPANRPALESWLIALRRQMFNRFP